MIGYCDKCTPLRIGKHPLDPAKTVEPKDRAVITLIREDVFNKEDFLHRKKTEDAKKLVAKNNSKGKHVRLSKQEMDRLAEAIEWLTRN